MWIHLHRSEVSELLLSLMTPSAFHLTANKCCTVFYFHFLCFALTLPEISPWSTTDTETMRGTSDGLVRNLVIVFGGIAFKSWSILQDSPTLFGLEPAIPLTAFRQIGLSTSCFSAAERAKPGGHLGAARSSRAHVKGLPQTCSSGTLSPPWCCSAVIILSPPARTQKCHVNMPTQELLDTQSYRATSSFIHLPRHFSAFISTLLSVH